MVGWAGLLPAGDGLYDGLPLNINNMLVRPASGHQQHASLELRSCAQDCFSSSGCSVRLRLFSELVYRFVIYRGVVRTINNAFVSSLLENGSVNLPDKFRIASLAGVTSQGSE